MRYVLALALICAVLPGISMQAQELDIYDINDFVDPRELSGDSFLISRAIAGGVTSYLDVFRPTNSDVMVGHLATNYYFGSWQANWKHTRLNREDFGPGQLQVQRNSSQIPENKNTLQLARYFSVGRAAAPTIIRLEATWTRADYRQRFRNSAGVAIGDFRSRFENEVSFEGDIPWRVGRFPVVTSLVYVGRFKSTNDDGGTRRVTLLQRAPRLSLGRWSLDSAVALGSVHANNKWNGVLVQPSLHVISPTIPGVNVRVHFKYAPAIGRLGPPPIGEKPQSRTENQFSIFIDRTLFAKLFQSAARQPSPVETLP
jgi:hypothetical protein